MEIWVINGPNLNFLGAREPEIYGKKTYAELEKLLQQKAKELKIKIKIFQSNSEGEIIDCIQEAEKRGITGILINPAAYTHYSLAIADALRLFSGRKVEVHLTNWYGRGDRQNERSVISPWVDGLISGLGIDGYLLGLEWIVKNGSKN